jgi:hypothetical protein
MAQATPAIHIRSQFITDMERQLLLDELSIYYQPSESTEHGPLATALGYDPNTRDASSWSMSSPIRPLNNNMSHNKALQLLYDIYKKLQQELELTYQKPFRLVNCILNKMLPGSFNPMHTDDQPGFDDPVHTCLIYLSGYNIDFTGGQLYFQEEDKTFEPKRNMLVFFQGDTGRPHEVREVLSGTRETITMQFTTKE